MVMGEDCFALQRDVHTKGKSTRQSDAVVQRVAPRMSPLATTCDCHERTFCYVGISSTGP